MEGVSFDVLMVLKTDTLGNPEKQTLLLLAIILILDRSPGTQQKLRCNYSWSDPTLTQFLVVRCVVATSVELFDSWCQSTDRQLLR